MAGAASVEPDRERAALGLGGWLCVCRDRGAVARGGGGGRSGGKGLLVSPRDRCPGEARGFCGARENRGADDRFARAGFGQGGGRPWAGGRRRQRDDALRRGGCARDHAHAGDGAVVVFSRGEADGRWRRARASRAISPSARWRSPLRRRTDPLAVRRAGGFSAAGVAGGQSADAGRRGVGGVAVQRPSALGGEPPELCELSRAGACLLRRAGDERGRRRPARPAEFDAALQSRVESGLCVGRRQAAHPRPGAGGDDQSDRDEGGPRRRGGGVEPRCRVARKICGRVWLAGNHG